MLWEDTNMPRKIRETGRVLFLAVACALSLTGCEFFAQIFGLSKFQLTIAVSPIDSGSVTADPAQAEYQKSSVVKLTANAASGWVFSRWEGDCTGSSNPAEVTMDADMSATAVFVAATSSAKTLYDFGFVAPSVTGTIDEAACTGAVIVPFTTAVTGLVAFFSTTGVQVKVGDTVQTSRITANDFTNPVTYSVVAADGTTQDYVVTVTVARESAKEFTAFHFLSPASTGKIHENVSSVVVSVPFGTFLTNRVAVFSTTGIEVRVGSAVQVSGTTENDFTNNVTYTVVAADGSRRDYLVMADVASGGPLSGMVTHFCGTTGGPGMADGNGTGARFNNPCGIATDGTDLYIADTENHTIRKLSPSAGAVTTIAGSPGTSGSSDGTGTAALFNMPFDVAYMSGSIFVADYGNHTIRRIVLSTGAVTTLAGSAGVSGSSDGTGSGALFYSPQGLASDGTRLYVADTMNHTIRKIDPSSGDVTTISGSAGISGIDNGTGSAARFTRPTAIASDGSCLYVTDSGTIRKIVTSTADVTTLAGNPYYSGSVDGSTGKEASFLSPNGIVASGGYLYVADSGNGRIRKVDASTGGTSTVAGSSTHGSTDGIGASAEFCYPEGIARIGSNLYVADRKNSTIRRIDMTTWDVTTTAGFAMECGGTDGVGSEARFDQPVSVECVEGFLYVADWKNCTIRKVETGTAMVTTLAGNCGNYGSDDGSGTAAGFAGPFDVAYDGRALYVTDLFNHTIRKIDPSTGTVTTLAGSTRTSGSDNGTGSAARFNNPEYIAFLGGFLYVSDNGNHTIRKIEASTGTVTTLAGSAGTSGSDNGQGSAARFNSPTGIACEGGFIYVADSGNDTIRRIDPSTAEVTTIAGSAGISGSADGTGAEARFDLPCGMAAGRDCLYVTEVNNRTVRMIDLHSGVHVSTIAGKAASSAGSEDGTGSAARFNTPSGVAYDGSFLYVVDYDNCGIRRIE